MKKFILECLPQIYLGAATSIIFNTSVFDWRWWVLVIPVIFLQNLNELNRSGGEVPVVLSGPRMKTEPNNPYACNRRNCDSKTSCGHYYSHKWNIHCVLVCKYKGACVKKEVMDVIEDSKKRGEVSR